MWEWGELPGHCVPCISGYILEYERIVKKVAGRFRHLARNENVCGKALVHVMTNSADATILLTNKFRYRQQRMTLGQ